MMQQVRVKRSRGQTMVITPPGSIGSAIVTMGPEPWHLTLQAPLDWVILRGELVELMQTARKVMG